MNQFSITSQRMYLIQKKFNMNKRFVVISDVDGCLTDGGLYYTSNGKIMKKFGVGDHEGVKLLKKNDIDIIFVTADKAGLPIVSKRMQDMSNSRLEVYNEVERRQFIESLRDDYDTIVFFGDGLGDMKVAENNLCDIFVCPKQSRKEVKEMADYVTEFEGGHGAYLDMAVWVAKKLKKDLYKELYD